MSNIAILPEKLCNQIAAGEVVERPASVVKELLENSLDAEADYISVEIERGGKKMIRVSDNGCGMDKEDIFLCFERHATSKIRSEDDLFNLNYHGFRGEAIPSIAAVARLTLTSCATEDGAGMKLVLNGGVVQRADEVARRRGTTFEVRDLFYNLPARRKFLRRDETEFGHISEIVTRLALAHPQVQFKLTHNGRTVLDFYRHNAMPERLGAVLGRDVAAQLLEVQASDAGMELHGYIAPATINRATGAAMYAFVNGRYIRDRVMQHAIMDGYRQLLMKGRYPLCVVFLTLPPAEVDVNVHPTKHEVRFRNQRQVHDFIAAALRERLRGGCCATAALQPATGNAVVKPVDAGVVESSAPAVAVASTAATAVIRATCSDAEAQYAGGSIAEVQAPPYRQTAEVVANGSDSVPESEMELPLEQGGYFSTLRIIGQVLSSYIVCDDGDNLVLVDQHAAHERIGFERLKQQCQSGGIAAQELLFPEILELSMVDNARMREYQPLLMELGFELESFGGSSWALKQIPAIMESDDIKGLLVDMLEQLSSLGGSSLSADARDAVLIKMACHGMIRANQPLHVDEMTALLRQLDEVDFNRHCPHGRPVVQRITRAEIEKMFRRT